MDKREQIIRRWFTMWLEQRDLGIADIFASDALYIESYGPEYHGVDEITRWFRDWNMHSRVLAWDIKGFFHSDSQTIVLWYFKSFNSAGSTDEFDGATLVNWIKGNKIVRLQEFGCNTNRYLPYKNGVSAQYRNEKALWF